MKTLWEKNIENLPREPMATVVTVQEHIHTSLTYSLQEILAKMVDVIKEIDVLMNSQLSPELHDWKRRQQIACIGGPQLTGLDQLQNWYQSTPNPNPITPPHPTRPRIALPSLCNFHCTGMAS